VRKLVLVAGVTCLLFVFSSVASGASLAPLVYNAFPPPPLPGNVSSVGFECCQVSEFGDEIRLSKTGAHLSRMLVVMSSWACETGTWDGGDCTTTPGATFSVPITFHVYKVVAGTPDTVGAAIVNKTQTFNIPYRPTSTPAQCGGDTTEWYSAMDATCYHGLAKKIRMDFPTGWVLPKKVIVTVSYNTRTSGYSPIGVAGPYDSLNIGTKTLTGQPTVGQDVDPNAIVQYASGYNYCDNGVVNVLRVDGECWGGLTPLIRIRAS
jgi:hypothetical protein